MESAGPRAVNPRAETSAFTDGVHGDLLTRLSGIADFRVTSRTSAMRYRDAESSLPDIARELGVAWILRGGVQQSGDRVRVHARLVDARRDQQIWAERYTRDLTADDLFALQEDYPAPRFYEALALLELDRIPEADSLLRGLELAWAPTAPRATAALVQLEAGDPGPARRLLEDLPSEGEPLFYRGLLHAALGDVDAALPAFEGIDGWERSPVLGWPSVSLRYLYPRALGPLRAEPRYHRVIAEIDRSWGVDPEGAR